MRESMFFMIKRQSQKSTPGATFSLVLPHDKKRGDLIYFDLSSVSHMLGTFFPIAQPSSLRCSQINNTFRKTPKAFMYFPGAYKTPHE